MIEIICNRADYEYDIHSLVKAFYPEEEISFSKTESANVRMEISCEDTGAGLLIWQKELAKETSVEYTIGQDTPKNAFKKFFYKELCSLSGKTLPWGNLTGIRPTKIAMGLLEEGKRAIEISSALQEKHCVSVEKAALSIAIATREKALMDKLDLVNGYSLYVGIPFCPTTCLYCSFTSNPIKKWEKRIGEYLECLKKELRFWSEEYKDKPLNTIYIGGGTPSSLSAEQLDELLTAIKELFSFEHLLEYTVEAGRPDSITPKKLEVLYRHNVSRISVNPQTMNQETLNCIGRCHTVEQTVDAFQMARQAGFTNINMDMILGLPGEDTEMVKETLRQLSALAPDSLTVHSLAVKRASKLGEWIEKNGRSALNDTTEMMEASMQTARELGMEPYYLYRQKNMAGNLENIGFSKPGKEGIYNILIMEEKQTIAAVGAGSITKRVFGNGRIERSDNIKDLELYMTRIDEMVERRRKLLNME